VDSEKRARLEAAGWTVGDAEEFLRTADTDPNSTPDEPPPEPRKLSRSTAIERYIPYVIGLSSSGLIVTV